MVFYELLKLNPMTDMDAIVLQMHSACKDSSVRFTVMIYWRALWSLWSAAYCKSMSRMALSRVHTSAVAQQILSIKRRTQYVQCCEI